MFPSNGPFTLGKLRLLLGGPPNTRRDKASLSSTTLWYSGPTHACWGCLACNPGGSHSLMSTGMAHSAVHFPRKAPSIPAVPLCHLASVDSSFHPNSSFSAPLPIQDTGQAIPSGWRPSRWLTAPWTRNSAQRTHPPLCCWVLGTSPQVCPTPTSPEAMSHRAGFEPGPPARLGM